MTTRFTRFLIPCSAASLLFGALGCASADSTPDQIASRGLGSTELGSLSTIVEGLRAEKPARSGRTTFPVGLGSGLRALVQAYDEENGEISMIGRAADSEDSEFILKVNEQGLYGWMVYHDRDVAWEYTTGRDGTVRVEEVPVSKIFPVCPVPPEEEQEIVSPGEPAVRSNTPDSFPEHVRGFPGNSVDVTKLQSRPESENVYYIDLTEVMNGTEPRQGLTKEHLWVAWSIAAAAHWNFDVNVTTDPTVYEATSVSNTICSTVVWDDPNGSSSCGLNAFGTRRCCTNRRYRDGYGMGRILDHEIGHAWGLGHDGGNNGGEYFNGFSDFQWTPLMGNVWPGDGWQQALFQWSKGEYDSATNQQDDLAIITRSVDYVEDDIPDTTPLVLEGTTVNAGSNWGHIARSTDTDSWTFEIGPGGGQASLRVERIEHRGGSMLDVDASILDSMEMTVAEDNASVARHAELDVELSAGSYVLVVKGGGEGTLAHGFSNYSSLGLYAISGTLTGSVPGGTGGMGGMGGISGMAGSAGESGAGGVGGISGMAGSAGESGAGGMGGMGGMGGTSGMGGNAGPGGAGLGGVGGLAAAGGDGGGASGSGGLSGSGGAPPGGGTSAGGMATAGNSGLAGTGGVAGTFSGGGAGESNPAVASSTADESGCACSTSPRESRPGFLLGFLVLGAALARRRRRAC